MSYHHIGYGGDEERNCGPLRFCSEMGTVEDMGVNESGF